MSDNVTSSQPIRELGSVDVILSFSAVTISLLAVACNSLLIYVIVRSKLLKTPTNIFIASLAVGEIIVGVFGIPFAAASVVSCDWPFSASVCQMSASLQTIGRSCSTYSLTAVCIDRCLAVSRPLKYSHILTLRTSSFVLACIWLLGIVMGFIPLGTWGSYQFAREYYMCTLFKSSQGNQHLVKEIICSYLPALFICLAIVIIIKEVKSHHRIFAIVQLPLATSSSAPGEILPGLVAGPRGFNRNTSRAMRSLFVVTCGYATFCLPVSFLNLVYQDRGGLVTPTSLVTAIVWLSFLCCVINPVIIILFNRKFRAQVKAIFRQRPCRSRSPKKDIFTISTGLHSILDATLVLNMVKHENASTTASTRRRILGQGAVK